MEITLQEIKSLILEVLQEKIKDEYLSGSPKKRERSKEIEKRKDEPHDEPKSYRPFVTDKDPKTGEPIKTKPSKWNKKFKDMFGESAEIIDDDFSSILKEFIEEAILLDEKKGDSVTKALKNKAEKANAPMSALRAIYNKGLAAWRTGHRPGASQHAWAMARVNSVLAGGPARKVDAAQWERIKKHRGKKRKKK